jgi:hypothetical protein
MRKMLTVFERASSHSLGCLMSDLMKHLKLLNATMESSWQELVTSHELSRMLPPRRGMRAWHELPKLLSRELMRLSSI